MIGSRSKIAAVRKMLLARGMSEEHLNRIHQPIGLPIMAETRRDRGFDPCGDHSGQTGRRYRDSQRRGPAIKRSLSRYKNPESICSSSLCRSSVAFDAFFQLGKLFHRYLFIPLGLRKKFYGRPARVLCSRTHKRSFRPVIPS